MTLWAANPRVAFTELSDGSGVLLHLDRLSYYTLNETACSIWRVLTSGPSTSTEEIAAHIAEVFDVSVDVAAADVDALLAPLEGEGFVERSAPPGA
jgi:hypothetical protein